VSDIALPYFFARPVAEPPWPGVLVLMEGNGMSPQLLRVCERLAHEGYAALAPDLFFRSGGSDPDKVPQQMMALVQSDDRVADIAAGVDELHRLGATSVGVTGFCMGGRLTYDTAVSDIDVQAAAPFYGAGIASVLAFFGGTDEWVPRDEIAAIEAHHAGQVVIYEQAGHGFMRDGSDSYDEAAAADAWTRLLAFFATHLQP
jgi:carboxymethylenebutenolidase